MSTVGVFRRSLIKCCIFKVLRVFNGFAANCRTSRKALKTLGKTAFWDLRTIVEECFATFRYCRLLEDIKMTSAKLKHRAKLQEWAARIQDCRSSGLSVRAWCRQEEINAATYYRWERELLALAETEPCSSVSAVRFAELPAPKQVSRNVAERSATLHIGNASLDIYPGCDTEQLKMLVELLCLC